MPQLKHITGALNGAALASYYDSGDAANAALLRNLAGTGLAFVPSSDFNFVTDALGYVQTDKGASLTFRVNNASEFLTADYNGSADASDYWVSFWVRGVVLAGEAPQAGQSVTILNFQNSGQLQTRIVTRIDDSADGFMMNFQTVSLTGATATSLQLSTSPSNTAHYPPLAWNVWHKITLHYRRGASSSAAGLAQIIANGRVLSQLTDFDGTPAQTNFGTSTDRNIVLPGLTNVRWQIAGPIESWSGRDIDVRPMYDRDGASRTVIKNFCAWHLKLSDVTQARDWEASGSGSVAVTGFSTSSTAPYRSRLVLSGNGDTPVVNTVESLGGPYYRDGWQTVAFSDIVVPSGCTGKIELLNAAGDAAVLTLNITDSELRQDATKVLDWSMPGSPSDTNQIRYSLFVHLGADGQAAVTLHNHAISNTAIAPFVFSAALPAGWAPQALGKLRFTATTTARSVELGQVGIGYEFDIFGIDSQSANLVTSSIQALRHGSGYPRGFNCLMERHAIPGGNWPNRRHGLRRQWGFAVFGINGLTRASFTTYALPGLTHARNLRFIVFDLGSINDIATINANDPTAIATQIVEQFKQFLDVVVPSGNRVWVSSMLPRDRSSQTTYTAQELAGIELANQLLRANLPKWNATGRIRFSDINKDYANNRSEYPAGDAMWGDDTHPSGTQSSWFGDGYTETARRMIQIATVPRSAQRNRVVSGNRQLARNLLGR